MTKNDEFELNIDKLARKNVIWICMSIIALIIGMMISPFQNNDEVDRDQEIYDSFEYYLYMNKLTVASITIHENMTLRDLRMLYEQFENQPNSQDLVVFMYKRLCAGVLT